MYPDAAPHSRLAAAPTVAEVTARVASLLAARDAAAVVARETAKSTDQIFLAVELPPPEAFRAARDAAAAKDSPPSTSTSPTPSTSSCGRSETASDEPRPGPSSEGLCTPNNVGSKCWLIRNLVCLGLAFMVLYIGMKGAVNLQSSVNAEGGRGNTGLAAYYTGFLLSNFFLPTIFIKWFGCKVTVIVAILAYIPYIGAQLFARFYTLVPGGLLAGLAAGPLWVSQGTYLSHLASVYTAHSGGSDNNDVLMARLFGVFYMLYQMSQVWGNLLSSAVLSKGETANVVMNGTREICGANFCAASSTSTDHLAQSKPAPHHLAIITFTYLACIVIAAAIVFFGVDPIPKKERTRRNSTSGARTEKKQDMLTRNKLEHWKRTNNEEKNYGACGELDRSTGPAELLSSVSSTSSISSGGTLDTESSFTASNRAIVQTGGGHGGEHGHGTQSEESIMEVFSATLRLASRVDLLLLVPITAFLGAEDTFLASDYTASYVSCSWGIHNIGYVMICFGVMSSTAAVLGGSLVKVTGRMPVVMGAAVLQMAVMTAMRVWEPLPSHILLFFAMAGMWGITDGIWQAQINAMYGVIFVGEEAAAYSNFRLWEGVGYILAYSYSTFLCTSHKLYILMCLMFVGMGGYFVSETRQRRRAKNIAV